MLRLADLREILRYVPQYRDRVFVIAVDGAVVEGDNFRNLLLDIALLRSLRIKVVLVHGAGYQIARLAAETGAQVSNVDGTGVTDAGTMKLAVSAAAQVAHKILDGLSAHDLRGAWSNAIVAHPAGILRAVDHLFTGRVERVDSKLLSALLDNDTVPVIPPLGCDGEGNSFRLNSDAVALEVARTLRAVKLIYLTTIPGIVLRNQAGELLRQLTVEQAEEILKYRSGELVGPSLSKLRHAVRAAHGGVPRIHIIDGNVEEGLLAEVFSNEGIGTLVHANEYQAIRRARKKDARDIYALIRNGIETEELLPRTQADIEMTVEDFFVFEVDKRPAGCVALHFYKENSKAELACLCVDPMFENQGIGVRLLQFVEREARTGGVAELFCLSTQAFNYFTQKGGFRVGNPDDLPPIRRQLYDQSGRRSQVLVKKLGSPSVASS